jgi:transcriptional regulator with XRE-family HTH domain
MGFVFPASFYDTETARFLTEHLAESSSKAPSRAERVASYERKERKPRLKKAQQLAIRLETTMKELIAVEQRHPAYRSEYSSEPFMESPRLRDFLTIKDLARVAVDGLNQAGYVKPGRRADAIKNELQKRLRGLGLSDKKIAEALKILGLEGAGDAADRVRQRRRRQK